MKRLLALTTIGAAVLLASAACGDDSDTTATVTPAPTTAAPTTTVQATLPASTPAPSSTATPVPPASTGTPASSTTPPAGFLFVPAPIDAAEILTLESSPPQYTVHITSGLPSGCHVFDHSDTERNGTQILIYVMNRVPDDPMLACTAIYGQHESTVNLGSDFVSGTTYKVQVNERMLEFTAQ